MTVPPTHTHLLLTLTLMISLSLCTQYTPIPKTPIGIPYGGSGQLTITAVYDPVCPDSANFDTNILRPLYTSLTETQRQRIQFKIVGQAKPWHLTSLKIVQGVRLVQDIQGNQAALRVFRYFLDNLSQWDNTYLYTKTITQFISQLSTQIYKLTGIQQTVVSEGLAHGSQYDGRARQQYKYSVGSLRSGINPSLYVNDVKIDGGAGLGLEQWKALVSKLG